jgi:hypothetical protein
MMPSKAPDYRCLLKSFGKDDITGRFQPCFFTFRHYTAQSIELMLTALGVAHGDDPYERFPRE